jgi:N utilization substance protein A
MSSEVSKMIQLICDEKGLSYEVVMEAVESAMGAAYRKDFGNRTQNIKFSYDPETGDMKAWDVKEVVEDISEEDLLAAQEQMTARREAAIKEGRELTEEETADLVGQYGVWAIEEAGKVLTMRCPLSGEYRTGLTWKDTH